MGIYAYNLWYWYGCEEPIVKYHTIHSETEATIAFMYDNPYNSGSVV